MPTAPTDSWLERLRTGDPDAAERLSREFFQRLVRAARARLVGHSRRVTDEEDVANSVLKSLCLGAEAGRFPDLSDPESLWPLLLAMTRRKVIDAVRTSNRQKRGGGDVRGESIFLAGANEDSPHGIDHLPGAEIAPDDLVALDEEQARLLGLLRDDVHRRIALWKLEGLTNDEIAAELDISTKSVERKLRNIRNCWSAERHAPGDDA